MRSNLPITQREYLLPEGATIVSTTDLDSRITYCNPVFVEASGYSAEELLGQPHNLLRHPDMPAEAFRDLWATVRAGQPWSGMVKNRRKNGDHYWVVANVTPIREDGQPVGYMSVRTRPSREQVQATEALYARMREEKAAGRLHTRIIGGRVERTGPVSTLMRHLRPGLSGRLGLAMVTLGAASAGMGALVPGTAAVAVPLAMLASGALALAAAAWMHHGITAPVRQLVQRVNDMAAGDLKAAPTSHRADEVGQLLRGVNQLRVNLQAMVYDIRSQSGEVHQAADEIAGASTDLSRRTEAQASSLQETAAALEQISSTIKQNADSAGEAHQRASAAGTVADEASQVVDKVQASMQEIEEASARIADIIGVIDGIAFQTNILALNAAVEAARAGTQGRGFAVVATEVRSLAQRSADAAREIKALVADSRSAVESGSQRVQAASGTMQQVVTASRRVGTLIGDISAASAQQTSGVVQINVAVAELDTATQQNAAMVEQANAAVMRLKDRAAGLVRSAQIFRLSAH
jgi:aerotaxis receptor